MSIQQTIGLRIKREIQTIRSMVILYCHGNHGQQRELCNSCTELLEYAQKRLCLCPFAENKSTCEKCSIHCYRPEYRLQIKQVMKYAGPRMIIRHPIMAIRHLMGK